MKETCRIDWIDYAKAIAIFCIVLLHANVPYPAKGLIRVWVIPLFFFLSGIFANTSRYATFRDYFVQKGLHILVPYVCFNILTYLFWLFLGRHYGYDAETDIAWWKPLWGIVYGEYSGFIHYIPLWFLACLFTCETLFYLIFRHIREARTYWMTVLCILLIGGINYYFNPIALPWGLGIAFPMMVFYATGAFFADRIRSNDYRILQARLLHWCFIGATLVSVAIYMINPGEVLVFKNEYGNYLLFYIGAFAGITGMMCACRLIEQWFGHLSRLSFIGRNTLIILCLHLIVFSFIKGISYYLFGLPLEIYDQTWVLVTASIANIVLQVPVILFINRFCPFITGKFSLHDKHA